MTLEGRAPADTVEILQVYARYEQWRDAGPFETVVALFWPTTAASRLVVVLA